jgi:predicted homoserine dehydrogenase-like protein
MSFQNLIAKRLESDGPIRVGLIGAGKFGSMFLAQIPTTPGISVAVIADLEPDAAKRACRRVGWPTELVDATRFVATGDELITCNDVEVVLEVTGHPHAGVRHARAAFAAGKHIIMVNVEADVLLGPQLAREAASAGVIYSMAYGDQPALTCELVDWARSSGFDVVAAGKGTKYLPSYHASTPETVWQYYGLTAEQGIAAGMNSQMFNSFLDGTKSAIEMAAIANATGLMPAPDGLQFPPCGTGELAELLRPPSAGGQLHHKGQVEVVSSLARDGTVVDNDLRWGVYVVMEAPNDYAAQCFTQYGLLTDSSGQFASMFKPFHLIGLELNISILSAVLRGEATGCTDDFHGDVVTTAKRDLRAGELLDGEGGYTVWGKLMPAAASLKLGGLPIGLAQGVKLTQDVRIGMPVRWADVSPRESDDVVQHRLDMENYYKGLTHPA